MTFDRKKFFDGVKDRIDSTLDQKQVDGLEFLITHFESDAVWKDVRHAAYALATIFHETAGSFQPVEEGYYTKNPKAFQKKLRYYPYFGRGYVQLTWKKNYDQAGKALGIDLVSDPDLAKEPETAFQVLTLGLFRGWFGGRLTTYINSTKTDYVGARHCVNGTDKAGLIAGYAKSFEKILRNSAAPDAQDSTGDTPKDKANTSNSLTPDNDPAAQPPTQIADTIVNTGDSSNTPPPEDKVMTAPPKDGATATSTKMVVAGVVVPPTVAAIIKTMSDVIQQGFVDAHEVGQFLLSMLQNNLKWILLLVGLLIVLLIVKKIIKTITFWLTMLSQMVPQFNNIHVTANPADAPAEKRWYQWWK